MSDECSRCGAHVFAEFLQEHVCPAPEREVKPLPTWPKGHCGQCDAPLMDDDEDARALLKALAAHLQVELPPDGWRATEYERDGRRIQEFADGAWIVSAAVNMSRLRTLYTGASHATAAEAAAAVSALEKGEPSP